jgi:hypothetical protein
MRSSRRQVLAVLAAATSGGLAGCEGLTEPSTEDTTTPPTESPPPTLTPTATLSPTPAPGPPSGTQQSKLLPEEGASYDSYGISVALDGDTALVSSCPDEEKGAVALFARDDETWTQQASLRPHDGERRDVCGSVALSGDAALVRTSARANGEWRGAAYVFVREDGTWSQRAKLRPEDDGGGDGFGRALALSGGTALVGANSDENLNGENAGSAYVFGRGDGTWSQEAKLVADGGADDRFGSAVALSDGTALVGAPNADGPSGSNTGAVYAFEQHDATWRQRAEIQPRRLRDGDGFGRGVALDGATALVGAAGTDGLTGAAYVFRQSGDGWATEATLSAPEPLSAPQPAFGASVALSGALAVVSTVGHNDPNREESPLPTFVFGRDDETWAHQARLIPDDGNLEDRFGSSVALADGVALVGAPSYDATDEDGVGSNTGINVGTGFVFE